MRSADLHPLVENLIEIFTDYADTEKAEKMSAYMKHHFSFIGLQKPIRNELQKSFLSEARSESMEIVHQLARQLWSLPEREYQYVAMELLLLKKRSWNNDSLELFEELVLNKSWWDTVDMLSTRMIGGYCFKEHEIHKKRFLKYSDSSNSWLNRVALIHQLHYKNQTDMVLFEKIYLKCEHKKEFFIQKAIGWALRQYSATNPKAVIAFTKRYTLSKLALREALRKL